MSEKYPQPDWAVSLWLAGHTLYVDLGGHVVQIPLDKCSIERTKGGTPLARQLGWNTLLTVLRDRESAGHKPSIAKRGAPVQYDVEGMLRLMKQKEDSKQVDNLDDFLKQEGLL